MTAATVSVEEQWAFRKGSRTPAGVTAGDIVREKEQLSEHFGRLPGAEEAAAVVLREPGRYHAHRAFAPECADEALRHAMEEGIRRAWSAVIRVKVQVTETRSDTGQVEVISRRVPGQPEVRWFHAVPDGRGGKVYDDLPSIASDPGKEAALSQDLADQARAFAAKVVSVTAELARLHQLREEGEP